VPSWLFAHLGVVRELGRQRQAPYSCHDAANAIPPSPFDGRLCGGVRPGQMRVWKQTSTNPIRLFDSIVVKLPGSTGDRFYDSFDYASFPAGWTASDNAIGGIASTAPTISSGSLLANKGDAVEQKVIRRAKPSNMKATIATSDVYRIGMYVRPYSNAHHGEYSIFARLDASPDVTADAAAIEARMTITGAGTVSVTVYKQNSALGAALTTTNAVCTEGWYELKITKGASDDTIEVFWCGESLGSKSSSTGTTSDAGWGIGLKPTTTGGRCIVDRVRMHYPTSSVRELLRPIKFFVQDGKLYHDKALEDHFVQSGTGAPFAADRELQCAILGEYVYFADNSEPLFAGTDGVISGNNTFSSSANSDLITNGLSTDATANNYFGHYAVHITAPDDKAGIYAISGLTDGSPDTLTIYAHVNSDLTAATGGATNGTSLTYRIERIGKFWKPETDVIAPWVSLDGGGTVPVGCRVIESDGGRIHLAGDPLDPNQVYGCTLGEPHNWSFATDSEGSAFELGTGKAAKPGDAVTAILEYKDDVKIIGCRSEAWIIKGSPPDNGGYGADIVSENAGVLGLNSHCKGEHGELFWVGRDGFYMATPECLACEPQAISKRPLPRELTHLSAEALTVTLGYDRRARGVFIFLTPNEATSGVRHWFYFPDTKGFFPVEFASSNAYPTAVRWVDMPSAEDSGLFLGCSDGSIRRFSPTAQNDDTGAIVSYIDIGPIYLGADEFTEGSIQTLRPILAKDSGAVTFEAHFGATAAAAMESTTAFATGTFAAEDHREHPIMGSGGAVRLRLIGTPGSQWALERVAASLGPAQRPR
jgi:hypothetical protein